MHSPFSPVTLGSPHYRAISVGGFRLTVAAFPAHAQLPLHAHAHTIMSVILSGGFTLAFETSSHECVAGTVFVEPSGERHSNLLGPDGAQVLVIEVEPDTHEGLERTQQRLLSRPAAFHRADLMAAGLRLGALLERAGGGAPLLEIEEQVLDLLSAASDTEAVPAPSGPWLERIRERLDASPNALLLVTDLAREAGVHRVHLGRIFRERYGVPLAEYHRGVRLRWAATQLATTDQPIGTIAVRAAFYDHGHFTRSFKRLMGVTPESYRRIALRLPAF